MRKFFYLSISSIFILLTSFNSSYCQLVAADECTMATPIAVSSACTSVNYTCIGASNSGAPSTTCGTFLGADVWFQVVVPSSGYLQIKVQGISPMLANWSVYSGTCGALTLLKCLSSSTAIHNINNPSLANQTLYVRVWRQNNGAGGNFSICAWEPNTVSNDHCASAISLSVGVTCTPVTYTQLGATSESTSVAPNPSCGLYDGGDVWFKVVVPASGRLQIKKTNVANMNAISAIYTGSCGAFTQIACILNNDSYNLNNASLAGTTIYIRVWDNNDGSGDGSFTLCAWEPPTPTNDFCSNAITLPVGTSCNPVNYTNIGCTAEPTTVAPNPSCGFYAGGDVWFKVIVPGSGNLRIERQNISGISAQTAIYTGSCGAMTQFVCLQSGTNYNISDISLAGQTLYIRVWNFNNAADGGTFSLCAWETSPPNNDHCANATTLPVNSSCNYVTYSNVGSTAQPTTLAGNPTCGFYAGGDIWFKVVVPSSGHLRIEKENVAGISAQSAIYTGTCGAFTQIACIAGNTAYNINNNALAGQTLHIRVWNFNAGFEGGAFKLCAWEPNVPTNDNCINAISLAVSTNCNLDTFTTEGCTTEPINVSPNPTCGFYAGGDIWFKIVMPSSGHLSIEKNNIAGSNTEFAVFQGTCGAMTQYRCTQNANRLNIHDHALGGTTIYLRVWNYNSETTIGLFSLCVREPVTPENDFCANAISLPIGVTCNLLPYNTDGCTAEATSVAANPSCGNYFGEDIWFKFIMPNSGLVTIQNTNVSPMSAQFAVYSGGCDNLTEVACSSLSTTFSINNSSLVGQIIYLRVWDFGMPDGLQFSLCLFDPTCLITIDSVQTSKASCSNINDGSLSIYASCTLCVGALEYSLNNSTYQSSNTFNNIGQGVYQIYVRDSGKPLCFQQGAIPVTVGSVLAAINYYQDSDGDNYGKSSVFVTTCSTPPANYVTNAGDCNDNNPLIHPGRPEIYCNNLDENCNSLIDDTPTEINVSANCQNILDGDMSIDQSGKDGTLFRNTTVNTSSTQIFTIENNDIQNMNISAIQLSGSNANMFSIGAFSPNTIVPPFSSIQVPITFTPTSIGEKNAVVTILNDDCNESVYDFAIQGNGTSDIFSSLNLRLFIEGYFIGNNTMLPVLYNEGLIACLDVCDTIEVELRHSSNYAIIASTKTLLYTNGQASCRFANMSGSHYVVIKHRNGLQTWSANPVIFGTTYDFSSGASKAYGGNQIEVETGIWALYSGDINQDENIDLIDISLLEGGINDFLFGYHAEDINGDGNVDLLDNPTVETNSSNFVFSIHP